MQKDHFIEQFAEDVLQGLSASPKFLLSKYFYDDIGSKLFGEIMQLPEYYLTKSEFEIFSTQSDKMVETISEPFHVIELGPGNGVKTKLLLKEALKQYKLLTYYPIDISPDSLNTLSTNLLSEIQVNIQPISNEYLKGVEELKELEESKLIVFMGSNIGNFSHHETQQFFETISALMKTGDHFLIGFDLKKDPDLILAAYNDSRGVTRTFNLNLLHRLNRELHADFDVLHFKHFPTYDPMSGEARSYLISEIDQIVRIEYLKSNISFKRNEAIYMEVSRKYDQQQIENYAISAGLKKANTFTDCKHYFADMMFVK